MKRQPASGRIGSANGSALTRPAVDLKGWRAQQGLNQEQLAAELGIHKITVSRWERGQVPVPPFLHLALWAIEHNAPR